MDSQLTNLKPTPAECQSSGAAIAELLGMIGSKWMIFVIMKLQHGPKRFSELERMIEGISQKVLTATLRGLEKDGLTTRRVTPTIPPRVDYELTAMGEGLCEALEVINGWALANREGMVEARERYASNQAKQRAAVAW